MGAEGGAETGAGTGPGALSIAAFYASRNVIAINIVHATFPPSACVAPPG